MRYLFIFIFVLFPSMVQAGHLHPERWYQDRWCHDQGGQVEYRLPDMTRCDCLTETNAIEVDFAVKWYQAIGQALYYAMQTGKRAGILLIIEDVSEMKYWLRMNSTIRHFDLPIDTWMVRP